MSTSPQLIAGNAGLPTFQQAINNTALQTAAGNCSNTQDFADKLNDAIQRLMIRGDWPGTILPIQLTVSAGVVTMPRIVGSVRAFNLCHGGIPVQGVWATFLDHFWHRGNCCGAFDNWLDPHPKKLVQFGTGVQFAAIPTGTCVLKVYCAPQDNGSIVQFFGLNATPVAITTLNPLTNTISDGISITLSSPFVVDTNLVSSISRVIKPITNAPIQVSALDTISGVETPIAAFDAGDTNPSFAQYKLHTGLTQCTTPPPTFQSVALVKLKFIPVVAPTDLITIPSLAALTMMVKAARFQDAGDRENFVAYQADAVKELNLMLADVSPDWQIPINVNPWGSASPSRSGIGRLR